MLEETQENPDNGALVLVLLYSYYVGPYIPIVIHFPSHSLINTIGIP